MLRGRRRHDPRPGLDAAGEADHADARIARERVADRRAAPETTLNTPGGRSVCATISANSDALFGVSSLGLMTIVLPVTSAGAILRAIRKNGKFHGRMPPITPIGWRNRKMFSFGRSLVMISPSMRRAHSAM